MSTDRELLELAAKAAGIKAKWFRVTKWKDTGTSKISTGKTEVFGTHHSKPWNPLTDDGDALRLAVALNIRLSPVCNMGNEACACSAISTEVEYGGAVVPHGTDKCVAMRLAILRAAAEIGRAMP